MVPPSSRQVVPGLSLDTKGNSGMLLCDGPPYCAAFLKLRGVGDDLMFDTLVLTSKSLNLPACRLSNQHDSQHQSGTHHRPLCRQVPSNILSSNS
jgi:hypothetical protein